MRARDRFTQRLCENVAMMRKSNTHLIGIHKNGLEPSDTASLMVVLAR
jgi:hypothetical protein